MEPWKIIREMLIAYLIEIENYQNKIKQAYHDKQELEFRPIDSNSCWYKLGWCALGEPDWQFDKYEYRKAPKIAERIPFDISDCIIGEFIQRKEDAQLFKIIRQDKYSVILHTKYAISYSNLSKNYVFFESNLPCNKANPYASNF